MASPMIETARENLLEVSNLKKYFPIKGGMMRRTVATVRAVDGVSFHVRRGETLGLVGESGCGKTTTGRTVLRLEQATAGEVFFEGKDVLKASGRQMKALRRDMQIVFQDPYASLDPRITVGESVAEGLVIHGIGTPKDRQERVREVLAKVGLHASQVNRFPHEFSGGQRQRIGLARTLSLNPRLVVADEPVSALDVSVQAQVLNLLQDLQRELGLSLIFVAHDLSVVEHISDRIAVMYVGKIVELAATDELLGNPLHPYTEALLSAIPPADPDVHNTRIQLKGEVPSPANPPSGCIFHPRCQYSRSECSQQEPPLVELTPDHFVSCHFAKELSLKGIGG